MAKTKDNSETPVDVVVPSTPGVVITREKLITFQAYCKIRNILPHHTFGMRAFVKNPDKPRTVTNWDEIFKSY